MGRKSRPTSGEKSTNHRHGVLSDSTNKQMNHHHRLHDVRAKTRGEGEGDCHRRYEQPSSGFRSPTPPTPPAAPYPPLPRDSPTPYSPGQQGPVCLPLPPPQPAHPPKQYQFHYSQQFRSPQSPFPCGPPPPPLPPPPPQRALAHAGESAPGGTFQHCRQHELSPPEPPAPRVWYSGGGGGGGGGGQQQQRHDENINMHSIQPQEGGRTEEQQQWFPSPPPRQWWQPPPPAVVLPQQQQQQQSDGQEPPSHNRCSDDDILEVWSGENNGADCRNNRDGQGRTTSDSSRGNGRERGRERREGRHREHRREKRSHFEARAARARSTNPPSSRSNTSKVRWSGDDVERSRDDRYVHSPSRNINGRGRRGRDDESDRNSRRTGKSCPPTTAKRKIKSAHAVVDAASGEHEDAAAARAAKEEEDVNLMDARLAEITSQMMQLQVAKEADPADLDAKTYLLLEEYKAGVAAGKIKAYAGKKYSSVDELYADGSAYNPTTRRWVKVACQNKNMASKANEKLMAGMEKLQQNLTEISKLSHQRAELQTKRTEIMLKEQTTRPTVTLTAPTAPNLVVFDTNLLMEHLDDAKCRIADIEGRHPDTSVLVPSEVLRELDGLKKSSDEGKSYSARKANRFLLAILEKKPDSKKRAFPAVRGQKATELYKDDGHHSRPAYLRGDDAILNCCLFFSQGIKTPRKVTLCTLDNNFMLRAKSNGLGTDNRITCTPGSCKMPLCPAPAKPSPFAGYARKR